MAMNETTYLQTLKRVFKRHREIAYRPGATDEEIVLYDALAELDDAIDRDDTRPWESESLMDEPAKPEGA